MTALLAEFPLLRLALLLGLFALVVAGAYFVTAAIGARQMSRRRLVDGTAAAAGLELNPKVIDASTR